MTVVKIGVLIAMLGCVIWLFVRLLKGKKPGKILCGSAIMGLAALFSVCIIGHYQTDILHINLYTLGTASILGIPGVILMVLVRILWQL